MARSYTEFEDNYIRKHFGRKSIREIAADLDRTYTAVKSRAQVLGVTLKKLGIAKLGERLKGQRAAIIACYGVLDSNETAIKFNTGPGAIRSVWARARERGDLPPLVTPTRGQRPEPVHQTREDVVTVYVTDRSFNGHSDVPRVPISLPRISILEAAE